MTYEENDSRRASPRVKCKWQVRCVTEQKKVFQARAVNISQGGIQITTPMAFKKGDRLYMEIAGYMNAEKLTIKVVGLAVYVAMNSQDTQLGLKFVSNLTIQDSKFIQQYVRSMLSN